MIMKHEPIARRLSALLAVVFTLVLCVPVLVGATSGQPEQPPAGYERVAGNQETLPAAPFLVAAYAIIWVVLIVYLWSIWRRLQAVQREVAALKRRLDEKKEA
jgi:CcmD family protein